MGLGERRGLVEQAALSRPHVVGRGIAWLPCSKGEALAQVITKRTYQTARSLLFLLLKKSPRYDRSFHCAERKSRKFVVHYCQYLNRAAIQVAETRIKLLYSYYTVIR